MDNQTARRNQHGAPRVACPVLVVLVPQPAEPRPLLPRYFSRLFFIQTASCSSQVRHSSAQLGEIGRTAKQYQLKLASVAGECTRPVMGTPEIVQQPQFQFIPPSHLLSPTENQQFFHRRRDHVSLPLFETAVGLSRAPGLAAPCRTKCKRSRACVVNIVVFRLASTGVHPELHAGPGQTASTSRPLAILSVASLRAIVPPMTSK